MCKSGVQSSLETHDSDQCDDCSAHGKQQRKGANDHAAGSLDAGFAGSLDAGFGASLEVEDFSPLGRESVT
jgi:hypothetical protein